MSGDTNFTDEAIVELENKMMSYCNLIPVGCWGFDDDVKESLKQRKHSLVNRQLSQKERKKLSHQQKQQLARGLGLVPSTVQEVLEWMAGSKQHSKVQPIKRANPPPEKNEKKEAKEKVKKVEKPAEESSDDEEEDDGPDSESEGSENEEETEELASKPVEDEDSDSSDEEDEEPAAKKSKPTVVLNMSLKSNDKIDKEIKKLEESENNEAPEIKRQVALLKIQKKLKEMKQSRKGKSTPKVTAALSDEVTEQKRLKRRESKLKLKQRRAVEKQQKVDAKLKKEEPSAENGVDEPVDKENSDATNFGFNKLKFEIKTEKRRGQKQRTAKQDRKLKLTGRDYKSLIAKVEETNAQIEKVREADPHKATIMEDELKWEKTMKRAAGGKVKDNLEKLKKALAKKEKLKEKKKEKWANREEKLTNEKNTKQDKRSANLQKRIDTVKKRKMIKLRKKGRIL